ncbi:MAG: metallophosphoesterase [Saprospiraceae bacterium]
MRCIRWLTISFFFLTSCATGKLIINSPAESTSLPPDITPSFSIYALGDAGELNDQSRTVMNQLKLVTSDDVQPGMVVFLGDNIYPAGFAAESDTENYHEGKAVLMNQINGLYDYKEQILFIPGNHDWNEFRPGGLDAIRREEKFIDNLNRPNIRFLPKNGCGGPIPIELNAHLVMLIIDSQWWIDDWTKEPHINEGCEIHSREEFIRSFHEMVAAYKDKQIIVAMHHPLYTQGSHGGHFSLKNHLFPLTAIAKWLYLPLPLIGSLYPFYRSVIGHSQDLKNHRYKSLRDELIKDLDYDGQMIFLAGHEHCLQYIRMNRDHFLISGAGSKQTAVANSKNLVYGHKIGGFMELDFYPDHQVWLNVYEVDPKTNSTKIAFSKAMISK